MIEWWEQPLLDLGKVDLDQARCVDYLLWQRFRYDYDGPVREVRQRIVAVPRTRHGATPPASPPRGGLRSRTRRRYAAVPGGPSGQPGGERAPDGRPHLRRVQRRRNSATERAPHRRGVAGHILARCRATYGRRHEPRPTMSYAPSPASCAHRRATMRSLAKPLAGSSMQGWTTASAPPPCKPRRPRHGPLVAVSARTRRTSCWRCAEQSAFRHAMSLVICWVSRDAATHGSKCSSPTERRRAPSPSTLRTDVAPDRATCLSRSGATTPTSHRLRVGTAGRLGVPARSRARSAPASPPSRFAAVA